MAANFPSHSILTSPSQKERNPDGRPDKTKTQTYISSYYSAAKIPNHSDTRVRSEATRAKRSRLKSIVSGPRTWRLLDAFHKKKNFFFFFTSRGVSGQPSRGSAWHDFLPFLRGSGPCLGSRDGEADVELPPAAVRLLRWGLGCALASCSPLVSGVSRPRLGPPPKGKTFHSWHHPELPCETHFLPGWKAGSSSVPREPGTPGRRASEGEGGDGARPEAAGPRAAHGGEDAELGRAWAVLGRRPHSRAARVLSRVRRPRPAPARPVATAPSRSRPAAQAGSEAAVRPSGRPSVRHGLCPLAFPPPSPSRPQRRGLLRVSSSGARWPAPRTEAASRAAAPPFSRAGDGRERGGEAEERKRGGGPGPARGGGSFCLTGRGGNSATAPAARGAEAARRRWGRGGLPRGRPNRPQPGEGRREPVSAHGVDAADVGGGGRAAGGPPPTPPARPGPRPPAPRDPARPPPPRPIEFLCTALIGAKRLLGRSPDLQAAGISFQPRRSDSL